MRITVLALSVCALCVFAAGASAQDADSATLDHRLELAQKMQDIRPVRQQVDAAIDAYVQKLPEQDREATRTALQNILNYKALEKISVDAMADTYSEAELEAMVEYYSKPEARSASDKYDGYANKVYPEIIRMLDQAMMRFKTGAR